MNGGIVRAALWPLIGYLRGGGGNGDNTGNAVNERMNGHSIVRAIRKTPENCLALVLTPRCPEGKIWRRFRGIRCSQTGDRRGAGNLRGG